MYKDALKTFKENNPTFIGAKIIYSPPKSGETIPESVFRTYFENVDSVCKLYKDNPEFVTGFDFVGREDKSKPLSMFANEIKQLQHKCSTKLYLHAGETNTTDEAKNMVSTIIILSRILLQFFK